MEPSLAGILVVGALLGLGFLLRAPLLAGFMVSLAFGATAIGTLTSLGGASPLVYIVFSGLIVASVAIRRRVWRELGTIFAEHPVLWSACGLALYAAAGAVILPRLLRGQTSAFIAVRDTGVFEMPLMPTSGNISQTGYLVLGILTLIALTVILRDKGKLKLLGTAFLAWCCIHAALGLIDLVGKLATGGDLLEPIRSASYAMLTTATEGSFSRIVGGFSEASAFGAATLSSLAYTLVFWRATGSVLALSLSLIFILLLVLSTSSTAYVGGAVLCLPLAYSLTRGFLRQRTTRQDLVLVGLLAMSVAGVLVLYLRDARFFTPFLDLLDSMVLNKASSSSGQERAYMNYRSLQSVLDTYGLGVGVGSSRASSWIVAVVSQLGIIGSLLMAALVARLVADTGSGQGISRDAGEISAIVSSARAAALAGLVSACLIAGSVEPGPLFFAALAASLAAERRSEKSSFTFAVGAGPLSRATHAGGSQSFYPRVAPQTRKHPD